MVPADVILMMPRTGQSLEDQISVLDSSDESDYDDSDDRLLGISAVLANADRIVNTVDEDFGIGNHPSAYTQSKEKLNNGWGPSDLAPDYCFQPPQLHALNFEQLHFASQGLETKDGSDEQLEPQLNQWLQDLGLGVECR